MRMRVFLLWYGNKALILFFYLSSDVVVLLEWRVFLCLTCLTQCFNLLFIRLLYHSLLPKELTLNQKQNYFTLLSQVMKIIYREGIKRNKVMEGTDWQQKVNSCYIFILEIHLRWEAQLCRCKLLHISDVTWKRLPSRR